MELAVKLPPIVNVLPFIVNVLFVAAAIVKLPVQVKLFDKVIVFVAFGT